MPLDVANEKLFTGLQFDICGLCLDTQGYINRPIKGSSHCLGPLTL